MADRYLRTDQILRHVLIGPPIRLISRLAVEGREYVPRRGAVVIAANHLSMLDAVVLPLAVGRPVTFLGKTEYFQMPGIKGKFVASFLERIGTIPVDRAGGRAAVLSLEAAQKALRDKRAFAIHPEGTRSPDGRLYRGKTGAARLALSTGAPVLPCGIIGTDRLHPVGNRMPRPAKVTVRFGPLLYPAAYDEGSMAVRSRVFTEDMMKAIANLSGQEFVDQFSPGPRRTPKKSRGKP